MGYKTKKKTHPIDLIGTMCPACRGTIHQYPATSRGDNKTYICSECGTKEGMIDYLVSTGKLSVMERDNWYLYLKKRRI